MSGVLLFQNYHKNGSSSLTVLLFRDKHSGMYSLLVGGVDPGETVVQTAARECMEESLNLFRPSTVVLSNSPYVVHKNTRCYILRAPDNTQSSWYDTNRHIINSHSNIPHEWRETDRIARVDINNLPMSLLSSHGHIQAVDTNGNTITIMARDKAIIREALQNNHINLSVPILCETNCSYTTHNPKLQFLNGTKCYFWR